MTFAGSWGRSALARWAPIPVRLIVGFGFMQHGFAKLSRGPDSFAAILHALGAPAPHFMAWVSILTELLGGLAVLVGAFVTVASIPMAILLLVAVFTVHLPNGFSSVKLIAVTAAGPQFGPVGYEVHLLYLACLAGLVLGGAGPFAFDAYLQKRKRQEPYLANADTGTPRYGLTEPSCGDQEGIIREADVNADYTIRPSLRTRSGSWRRSGDDHAD